MARPPDGSGASRPKLRGWLHAVMFPIAVIAGIVLVSTATRDGRAPSAIFAVTAALLFGTSALLHRGSWTPGVEGLFRRMDHSNIYLIIAGTYTPFAVLALPPDQGRTLLLIVWIGALAGVVFRVFGVGAPRWLYTLLYVVIGWVAVFFIPDLIDGAGAVAVVLIAVGGLLYTVGAVVYGTKRPNPSPVWFGFHEVFHALTIGAFIAHYVAVWIVVHP
ncbi:MAG TPA: hemolysin III family protein [Acidimicrobiia bacterium]|nr:hemolysin III family protein [Acidimicrobiia bacterium]